MVAVIVQIDGYDPVAAAAVSVYAGSHDDPAVCHYNGQTWWPVLGKLPTPRYDLFDGAFTGQITAPSSSLSMQIEPWPNFGRYILADGRLRFWTGGPDDNGTWTLRFDGRVTGQPNIVDGSAQIDFAVDDRWLDTALLTTYAGTSGAEGPAGLKGQAKPLAIGVPRYVPGKLVDSVNSVFQVSSYGSIVSFDTAMERLARFSTSVGDYASYAALVAASIPAGRWGSAKAVGMARFGAPPVGQVSFLLQGDNSGTDGHVRRPGAITRRIAALSGGTGKTDDTTLNALDTARPYNLSLYFEDQTTARGVIQNLAASVNAVAGVSWTGKLFVLPVAIGTATVTLAADGSALPPVARVEQINIASPWQKLAITAEPTWAVHTLADIAFTAELIDVGNYTSGTTYREGNIVSLTDGSRWLYTATTPTSGNEPETESAFWTGYSGATVVDFSTGVTGDTKPEDNATVGAPTGSNVAGRPAEDVVSGIDDSDIRQTTMAADAEIARLRLRALNYPGPAGESHFTLAIREQTARAEANDVFAETFNLLGAVDTGRTAFVLDLDTVKVGASETFAQRLTLIDSTFGPVNAAISTNATAIADEESARATAVSTLTASLGDTNASVTTIQTALANEGGGVARALLRLDVDGRIIGFAAYNDGETGDFIITTDRFALVDPDTGVEYLYADVDGNVFLQNVEVDTIKARAITGTGLNLGALGSAGFYFRDSDVTASFSGWTDIATVTVTPAFGKPLLIHGSTFARSPDSGSTPGNIRLVRIAAGVTTIISGGDSAASRLRVEADGETVAMACVDGSVQGQATTYSFQMKRASPGERILCAHRFMSVVEQAHVDVQTFDIAAATGGGPAAGATGGGGVGVYDPNQMLADPRDP